MRIHKIEREKETQAYFFIRTKEVLDYQSVDILQVNARKQNTPYI